MGSVLWRRGIANLPEGGLASMGTMGYLSGKRVSGEARDTVYLEAAFTTTQRPRRACGAYRSPMGSVT